MIRHATHDDLPEVLRLLEGFHAICGANRYAAWGESRWSWERWVLGCIDHDLAACILAATDDQRVVGVCTAAVVTAFWNKDVKALQETVLYVEPFSAGRGYGKELVNGLIDFATAMDCDCLAVGSQEGMDPRTAEGLYRSMGFSREETVFSRRIK